MMREPFNNKSLIRILCTVFVSIYLTLTARPTPASERTPDASTLYAYVLRADLDFEAGSDSIIEGEMRTRGIPQTSLGAHRLMQSLMLQTLKFSLMAPRDAYVLPAQINGILEPDLGFFKAPQVRGGFGVWSIYPETQYEGDPVEIQMVLFARHPMNFPLKSATVRDLDVILLRQELESTWNEVARQKLPLSQLNLRSVTALQNSPRVFHRQSLAETLEAKNVKELSEALARDLKISQMLVNTKSIQKRPEYALALQIADTPNATPTILDDSRSNPDFFQFFKDEGPERFLSRAYWNGRWRCLNLWRRD